MASAAGSSPVAVPGIFVGVGAPSSSADRGHSLSSLYLPPAALESLPISVPVILYGTLASVLYELIYWISGML